MTKINTPNLIIQRPVEEKVATTATQQKGNSVKKAGELLKKLDKEIKVPIEVFPPEIQNFILTYYTYYKYPIDYYFASVLTCAGVAIGNAYTAQYQPDWEGVGMLWTVLVGGSSIGKSQAMKPCLKPLRIIQEQFVKDNEKSTKIWEAKNPNNGSGKKNRIDLDSKPKPKRIITNKATIEKAIELLDRNPKGLLFSRSEIKGWLKSMNQYNNGDDEETYMEWWDNDYWSDDKKSTGFVYIKRPFSSILGGIQTKIVQKMAAGDSADSGFFQRLLFAMPTNEIIPTPKEGYPNQEGYKAYEKAINNLYGLPNKFNYPHPDKSEITEIISCNIPLSEDAKKRFYQYRCTSADKRNDTDDDVIKSMLGKLETYVLRFAVILELLEFVCSNSKKTIESLVILVDERKHFISKETIEKAIKIADYFEETGRRVTSRIENPVNRLKPPQQAWYNSLPEYETFKAQTAIEIAKAIREKGNLKGLGDRTVKGLLRNKELFKKVLTGGYYERIY